MRSSIRDHLFRTVSAESLALFRIAFSLIMLWEVDRYLRRGAIGLYWVEPNFNFTYTLLPWLAPLPGDGMFYLFYALGALALLIGLGLFYRVAVALFSVGFTYTFLLDESLYLNHVYLICLLAFLMIFVPANRAWSLDARLFRLENRAPAWAVWLLRFQVGVPYFFGGVAKLNPDWLRGEPITLWLAGNTDFPLFGPLFTEPAAGWLFAYGGLLLDLLAVPGLLAPRTRALTFGALTLFHLTNATIFSIGLFPWLMMLASTIFFPPDWPTALRRDLGGRRPGSLPAAVAGAVGVTAVAWWWLDSFQPVPLLTSVATGVVLGWALAGGGRRPEAEAAAADAPAPADARASRSAPRVPRGLVLGLLAVWALTQVTVPLRHFLIPGRSSWTEEGHRFAWHMMLRSKRGSVTLLVRDPVSGRQQEVDPGDILPDWQLRQMVEAPHMIHAFVLYSKERFAAAGFDEVEIRVIARASLNGREPQLMIDPSVDLTALPRPLWHAGYIEPLKYPLRQTEASRP